MTIDIEQKLDTLVRHLNKMRIERKVTDLRIYYLEDSNPSLKDIKSAKGWKLFKAPYYIFKNDFYCWFKCEFDIDKKNNKNIKSYLGIDTYINPETDCNLRPQGVLYLNDHLEQGIDINHTDVLIKKDGHYEMYLHLYVHDLSQVREYFHEHNTSFPLIFTIKYKDQRVEDAYYDFLTIYDGLKVLLKTDKRYLNALPIVNNAMNLVDLRNYGDDLFKSLVKARKYLFDEYFNNPNVCGKENYTIDCLGHAHIDMAWLWDLEQTHHKGIRTFSSMIKLMDEYPEFKYVHTSPQLYKFIKQDCPDLYKRVKEKIKEGRFEIDGAMWIEPDCNLTSGESLVRQLLYGKDFIKKEFNVDSKILILPDVFGYAYQLPQILKKSGVDQFITAKIGWNDTNQLPHDSFMWKGMDGTSIFTYLISTCDINPRAGINVIRHTTYNGWMSAAHLLGTWNRYEPKKYNNEVITTYGYGDGGGGPTREMIEKERRFKYGLPGIGKTRIVGVKEALKSIESNFNKSCKKYKSTPTWNDELYLEYHRGTYTSVPRIKKLNREIENSFLNTELLASLSSIINNKNYPNKIKDNYETFLLHQFHDILPGSSIEKVYQDADKFLGDIKDDNNKIINDSLSNLLKTYKSRYMVFNPNAFNTSGTVTIDNKCYVVDNVPSVGYKSFKPVLKTNKINVKDYQLSNEYFDIRFNKKGEIVSLLDKINHKELVKKGGVINKFIAYEDTPFEYDNWEIAPGYEQKKYVLNQDASFTKLDEGDRKGFKITRKYFNSVITQFIYLYNGINRIDFVNKISWKEKRQLLKVHFPFNINCEQARYDVQFGSIGRNTKPKNSFDEAKFEVCAQKWVDVSDNKYGVTLINDGKYGHGCRNNDLSLTLLKSGSYPYEGASDIVPTFTYSLFAHKGNYQNDEVIKQGYLLNRPLILIENKNIKEFNDISNSFISTSANGVFLETFKKAHNDNSYILRGYEAINKERDIEIKLNLPFKEASLTDLMENEIKKITFKNKTIKLHVKPFEIFTIKLS